jgi:hypothetical protein
MTRRPERIAILPGWTQSLVEQAVHEVQADFIEWTRKAHAGLG